jgi:hypothetical protein
MPRAAPPHLQSAFEPFREAWQKVQGAALDVEKTPWAEIEKGVIKLFGGPFRLEQPEHQGIALRSRSCSASGSPRRTKASGSRTGTPRRTRWSAFRRRSSRCRP